MCQPAGKRGWTTPLFLEPRPRESQCGRQLAAHRPVEIVSHVVLDVDSACDLSLVAVLAQVQANQLEHQHLPLRPGEARLPFALGQMRRATPLLLTLIQWSAGSTLEDVSYGYAPRQGSGKSAQKKRADERTRTADLLITSVRSVVAECCRILQIPHGQRVTGPCIVHHCRALRAG